MKKLLLLLVVLSGCMKYTPPSRVPPIWQSPIAEGMNCGSPRCFAWWKSLNDPELECLMKRASLKNYDLLIARDVQGQDSCTIWMEISSEVAKSYSELRGMQQRIELIDKHIESQKETVQLTKGLMTSGFLGIIDQIQAEEVLSELMAKKPLLEQGMRQSIYHISTLLGNTPGALCQELMQPSQLPEVPCNLPIGCPSDFLERKLVGGCKATLKSGVQIVTKGRCKIKMSGAFYAYEKAANEALEEVESSLTAFYYAVENNRSTQEAHQMSQEAYKQIYQLYERGLKSYIEVLVIQQALFTNEEAYIQSRVQLLNSYIELYKALYVDKARV